MQTINARPPYRLNLCKSTCAVRDDRWSIEITSEDSPVDMRVEHRQHGDYYDWPEGVFEGKGPAPKACARAYDLQEKEVTLYTRGKALAAAHAFLKAYGSGEVEYLEWDINSQSMVVVGHSQRGSGGLFWPDARLDPLAPYYAEA